MSCKLLLASSAELHLVPSLKGLITLICRLIPLGIFNLLYKLCICYDMDFIEYAFFFFFFSP
jgi:hypothetical protein